MIEAYPFFLQKDHKPYRFNIIENDTHQIIKIGAKAEDDLDFTEQIKVLTVLKEEKKKCLLEIDFGFHQNFDLTSQLKFSSCILAIEEIVKKLTSPYKDVIEGLILFRGSAFLEQIFFLEETTVFDYIASQFPTIFDPITNLRLAIASILGSIFHRLVSFVDDDLVCFAIFYDADKLDPFARAILFSKARFEHIFLVYDNPEFQSTNVDLSKGYSGLGSFSLDHLTKGPSVDIAILLPEDDKLTSELVFKIKNLTESLKGPYRMIPEKIFNESWNDIQTVYYIENAIHPMTQRMVKGFEASGGQVIVIPS